MTLRRLGYGGAVDVITDESHLPYDRTLVSKDALTATAEPDPIPLSTSESYDEQGITVRTGARAVRLVASSRIVQLEDGSELAYDRLVVCTGGRPIIPPPLKCPGVLTLRTHADTRAVRAAVRRARHLVVIGGGFVGGEVTTAAVTLGAAVTLIEAAGDPLTLALGAEPASRIAHLHRQAGVAVLAGVSVTGVRRERDGYTVELHGRPAVRADAVVVGVGMASSTDWLAASPVALNSGVLTNEYCESTVPGVFAAGDCARWHHPLYAQLIHVEHWDTACRHGEAAAANVLNARTAFAPLPFFWSEQHGVHIRYAGYAPAWDEVDVDGQDERSWIARYLSDGRLVAVCAVSRPRDFAVARKELEQVL
jgi:NADPH-dependent 2,4-dienoyl-CoA reductase/sulfur reductase-like enzyme